MTVATAMSVHETSSVSSCPRRLLTTTKNSKANKITCKTSIRATYSMSAVKYR